MNLEETIKQLKNLEGHCWDMQKSGEEIWEKDCEALSKAISLLIKIKSLFD